MPTSRCLTHTHTETTLRRLRSSQKTHPREALCSVRAQLSRMSRLPLGTLRRSETLGRRFPSDPTEGGPLRRPTRLQDGHRCEQERRGACTDPSWRWRGRGPQSPLPSLETPEALFSSSLVRTMDRDGPKKEALLFLSHRPRPLSFWAAGVSEAWQQGILLTRVSYYSPKRERGVDVAGVSGGNGMAGSRQEGDTDGWVSLISRRPACLTFPATGEGRLKTRHVEWAGPSLLGGTANND